MKRKVVMMHSKTNISWENSVRASALLNSVDNLVSAVQRNDSSRESSTTSTKQILDRTLYIPPRCQQSSHIRSSVAKAHVSQLLQLGLPIVSHVPKCKN
jgi:hypothetical protein